MDVLYPELEDIDGSIYRINVIDELNIGRDAEKLHYTEYGSILLQFYRVYCIFGRFLTKIYIYFFSFE